METIELRKKLHQCIDESDDKLLRLLYAVAREYNNDDEEHRDWNLLNKRNLERFYSKDEPEYNLNMVKEPNPEYKNESR